MEQAGAIVLAGGLSRRMGTDKALLRLQPGGPRLIELVLAALTPLAGEVVISTNRPAEFAWLDWPKVVDNYPLAGPLAGLEAALSVARHRLNVVVACDMPFIKPALLGYLLERAATGAGAATVPLNRSNRPEPLCAVYSRECLPAIRQHLQAGKLKLTDWLEMVPTMYVPAEELAAVDPDLSSFSNLNSLADLPGQSFS